MSEYVEARSLAALNQLAANPPQYPTKPNEVKQDPLTLYISRVPGTRDVILSTLKPQIKNVTAEDVSSSLYYVHFQTPEDEPLVPLNHPRQPVSPRSSGETSRPRIHRKPLPKTAGQPTSGITPTSPAAPSGRENGAAGHRIPLSPRSPLADVAEGNAPPLPTVPRPPPYELPHLEDRPPPLPARPRNNHSPPDLTDALYSTFDPTVGAHAISTKRRVFTPFSLTLIRRDPSSGQQWNVGKIASFQLENPDLIDDEKRHQPSPSIQVHLETSGYAKFRGMPAGAEVGLRGSLDLRPGSSSSTARQFPSILTSMPASGAFERQVKMMYSPSFTAAFRKHFRSRSSVDEGRPTSPIKRPGHGREDSQISLGSFGGDFDGGDAPIITQPAPGLKPRGYVFYSPWNGRCEFMTGKAGRTLKCRHVLPSYGGGVYNPLVEGSDLEHGDERADSARPISELRFNLPSNELLTDKKSIEGGARARDQIQSQFNKIVAKAQGLEDSDDGEPYLDLSLGREKAGGGNRGKRAKMGKLIILDEGLKMLDLAVAANVGIWWTTWERTFESS
ncbi:putative oxidoreductase-like protein [Rosellinia necatrix]|uniref:Putative oxidoreductase-like protein n=1 Tax=Rosellinia necatrix TaxID=77044 RepID=A0A1S7UK66_ROSNE|nr:putative oxidoreductase-like protein [Rosellinia necatrix]